MSTKLKRSDIPKDFPVRPLMDGQKAGDKVTCGACELSWDDSIATSYTPAPSPRCPFEAFHKHENDPIVPRNIRLTAFKAGDVAFYNDVERKVRGVGTYGGKPVVFLDDGSDKPPGFPAPLDDVLTREEHHCAHCAVYAREIAGLK